MPIIEVKHLTKEYDLGAVTSIKDNLRQTLAKIQGKDTWQRERFKALDDVSFTIEEGEVVGIIGHNGAGKSTLLKHLANITKPTSGEVVVRGSIAPLIEVGAGVNPELTGRENIYLNGAILGIPKKVIQSKLEEIIDFSELEQFIDTPVKRYSSGMTVKLGFSIATSMDADILIIDEVLAVGDLAFQRKCFDKMEDLIKQQGKTVLLVSHNIRQVQRLCNRVILLKQGQIMQDGAAQAVCESFYKESDAKINANTAHSNTGIRTSGDLELIELIFLDQNLQKVDQLSYNKDCLIQFKIRVYKNLSDVTFGFGFHTTDFLYLTTHNSEEQLYIKELSPGEHYINCKISELPLLPGVYSLRFGVTAGQAAGSVFYGENMKHFQVIGDIPITAREGFFMLNAHWSEEDTKPKINEIDMKNS